MGVVFREEGEAHQVHETFPRHLKGNAGKRDVCCMVRDKTQNKGGSCRSRFGAKLEERSQGRALWGHTGLL